MRIRHLARQRALQLLYGLEFNGLAYEEGEAEYLSRNAKTRKGWSEFSSKLAKKTFECREELDAAISATLEHWKIDRIALTDRICLRMALTELREFPDIPLRVTFDEYIELARSFGTEDSPQFVNGVLDKLAKDFKHKDFQTTK